MTPSPEELNATDPGLFQKVKQYDADAWAVLVHLFGPHVYDWCRQLDVTAEDAAEIVWIVFDGVSRAVGNFRRELTGEGFRQWLWSITRNKVKQCYRRYDSQASAQTDLSLEQRISSLPAGPPADIPDDASDKEAELARALVRAADIGRDPAFGTRRRGRGTRQ